MSEIFKLENFKPLKPLEYQNLSFPGIYALRIKSIENLPSELRKEIKIQKSSIIYIGKATQHLSKRLEEECRGKRHGTFFRAIGALLNFRPPMGSLAGKTNSNNYKFNRIDNEKIVEWMNENFLFDCIEVRKNIDFIERDLIKHFCPILNTIHNPFKSRYLALVRKECRDIALKRLLANISFLL